MNHYFVALHHYYPLFKTTTNYHSLSFMAIWTSSTGCPSAIRRSRCSSAAPPAPPAPPDGAKPTAWAVQRRPKRSRSCCARGSRPKSSAWWSAIGFHKGRLPPGYRSSWLWCLGSWCEKVMNILGIWWKEIWSPNSNWKEPIGNAPKFGCCNDNTSMVEDHGSIWSVFGGFHPSTWPHRSVGTQNFRGYLNAYGAGTIKIGHDFEVTNWWFSLRKGKSIGGFPGRQRPCRPRVRACTTNWSVLEQYLTSASWRGPFLLLGGSSHLVSGLQPWL